LRISFFYDKVFQSIAAMILDGIKMVAGSFFLLDLDLDMAFLKRTWTRTWTCPLKVDLDLRIVDLDLDLAVAGLVTSLMIGLWHVTNTCTHR